MGGRREEDRKTQRENFYAFLAILASGCLEVLASKNWLWSILLAYLSNFRAKGFVRTQSLRIRITQELLSRFLMVFERISLKIPWCLGILCLCSGSLG